MGLQVGNSGICYIWSIQGLFPLFLVLNRRDSWHQVGSGQGFRVSVRLGQSCADIGPAEETSVHLSTVCVGTLAVRRASERERERERERVG